MEWAVELLSKKWTGWVMGDTPQSVMTTRAPAVLTNEEDKNFTVHICIRKWVCICARSVID